MRGFIYKITNTINGKVYIGQTIQRVQDRWYRHCQRKCLSFNEANMPIKRAIFKYGKENFTIETIEECDSEVLDDREIYYISLYNSLDKGYNCTKGGQSGSKPLKIAEEKHKDIISLYTAGFSLRDVAMEYNVDKATIKHILRLNKISLRATKTYKFSQIDREKIMKEVRNGVPRKEIMDKWKISHSYLSQLVCGKRRI